MGELLLHTKQTQSTFYQSVIAKQLKSEALWSQEKMLTLFVHLLIKENKIKS